LLLEANGPAMKVIWLLLLSGLLTPAVPPALMITPRVIDQTVVRPGAVVTEAKYERPAVTGVGAETCSVPGGAVDGLHRRLAGGARVAGWVGLGAADE